jgi:nicotinate-nucleotide adenylyltransferase
MAEVGLFFGSFNPIHIGHLIIAQAMLEGGPLDEVWFVVSPQNPHKSSHQLAHEFDRLDMVELAIGDNRRFRAVDVEFRMPRPNYTVHTLAQLSDKHPAHRFRLIVGEDNLESLPRWKNYEVILREYGLLVYPRPGAAPGTLREHPSVRYIDAPLLDISASYVRQRIAAGFSVRYLLPEKTARFIDDRGLYRPPKRS